MKPPISEERVTVIIPCYNEERRIQKESFSSFLSGESNFEFLFVDDGSRDRTYEVLSGLCRENPTHLQVIKLANNSGKAEAVRQGFLYAMKSSPDFIAYWDADLATPLETLPDFLNVFREKPKVEIVLGSRVKLMGRDIQRHASRHYLGRIFATFASFVLQLDIYDTQCGAKMFRNTELLLKLFQEPFRSKWIFDVELIARYILAKQEQSADPGAVIYELPLPSWKDVQGSKVKPHDFFKAFYELVQIAIAYR